MRRRVTPEADRRSESVAEDNVQRHASSQSGRAKALTRLSMHPANDVVPSVASRPLTDAEIAILDWLIDQELKAWERR